MTEHSFHGINTSRPKAKSVTHVSGTVCHLCLRLLSGRVIHPEVALAFERADGVSLDDCFSPTELVPRFDAKSSRTA